MRAAQALQCIPPSESSAVTSRRSPASVSGHGLEALRAAGIQVSVGPGQSEARRLNEGFARWIQHRRPFVLMKVAMTLDARIAPPPAQMIPHAPYWITSEVARAAVQHLRWAADATMVGVDTVLADDPWMTDRSGLRRRRPLLRIVLDSALRMPLDCKLVTTAQNDVVIFTVSTDETRIHELESRGVRVEVLPAETGVAERGGDKSSSQARQPGRVPLEKVLDKLGDKGILTLLTETGTRLNTAFLAAGLVDRFRQAEVGLLGKVRLTRVRAPQQPANMHATSGEVGQHEADLGARPVKTLIGIALPVGEVHRVVRLERGELLVQASEVLHAVDEHLDLIALRPRGGARVSAIDLGCRVPALVRGQEPICEAHGRSDGLMRRSWRRAP